MWWIAGGVVLLGFLLLVVVLMAVAGHLRPLRRAVRRLQLRTEQAEGLQGRLLVLQERVADLQRGVEQATAQAERVKAGRTAATG